MSGFSFGTPQPTNNTNAFGFGAAKTQASTMPFGTANNLQTTPAFGTTGAVPAFGTQTAMAPAFGAHAAAAAPAFGSPGVGTPAFGNLGTTPTAGPAFGATAATTGFGGAIATPAFGATAATPAFGATAATPAFGATAATPAFGATAATPAFGVTAAAPAFGAPTAAPAFGTTAVTPAFGTLTSTVNPTFGLNTATSTAPFGTVSAAPAFGTGNTFGTLTSTAPTLGLGTAAPAFGALGNITTAAPAFSLGTGTSFSFNKPTTAVGALPTATTLFGAPSFGKTAPTTVTTTAPTPFVGLGGIDLCINQPKAGDYKQDNIKVKETYVPDEIAKTVDALKNYIKAQKSCSSDISRISTSKLTSVTNEITNLNCSLGEVGNSVEANKLKMQVLRNEDTKIVQSLEMAQRTHDTPGGLQMENMAPFTYFESLLSKYEADLANIRHQIAVTEQHMQSLTNPRNITPNDLKQCLRQINESFISLAGRAHKVHQKVEIYKQQYLQLRKHRLNDTTNVFAELEGETHNIEDNNIIGPTPFSSLIADNCALKTITNCTINTNSTGSLSNASNAKQL